MHFKGGFSLKCFYLGKLPFGWLLVAALKSINAACNFQPCCFSILDGIVLKLQINDVTESHQSPKTIIMRGGGRYLFGQISKQLLRVLVWRNWNCWSKDQCLFSDIRKTAGCEGMDLLVKVLPLFVLKWVGKLLQFIAILPDAAVYAKHCNLSTENSQ